MEKAISNFSNLDSFYSSVSFFATSLPKFLLLLNSKKKVVWSNNNFTKKLSTFFNISDLSNLSIDLNQTTQTVLISGQADLEKPSFYFISNIHPININNVEYFFVSSNLEDNQCTFNSNYNLFFQNSELALMEEDYSEVFKTLSNIEKKKEESQSIKSYVLEHDIRLLPLIKIIRANPASLKLYQVLSKEDLEIQFTKLYRSESELVFIDEAIKIYKGQKSIQSLSQHYDSDGRKLDVLCQTTILTNTHNEDSNSRVLVSFFNLSKSKQLESSFKIERDRLLDALYQSQVGFFEVNYKNGDFFFTENFNKTLNFPLNRVDSIKELFSHLKKITLPTDFSFFVDMLQSLKKKDLNTFYRFKIKTDYGDRTIKVHVKSDVNQHVIFGTVLDLSEPLKEQIKNQRLKSLFKGVIESTESQVFSLDLELNYTCFNSSHQRYLLNKADKIASIGSNILKFKGSGFFNEHFFNRIAQSLEGERSCWECEFENRGDVYGLTFNPIFCERTNEIVGVSVFVNDITQDREARKLMNEAKNYRNIAEKENALKDEFLANMSHEIRTPLNGIVGMTDVLSETILDGRQLEYINTIKQSSANLLNIINDILDLSKLEAGKLNVKQVSFNIYDLANKVSRLFKPLAEKKGLILNLLINDLPPFIKSDPIRVEQIISNLLSNAIKFTIEGEINLVISLIDKMVFIEVADTGMGIKDIDKNKLFKKFSQIDSSVSKSYVGTGLGLVICKNLIELLGGEINVKSNLPKGSVFYFTIPFVEGDFKESDTDIKTTNNSLIGKHILLVEDKEINQKVVSLMLNGEGAKVTVANNGLEAIEIFEQGVYDLILMDIQMPVMDGVTATIKLRKQYKQLPPIVGLSANAMKGDLEKYLNSGLDNYIEKPVTKNVLTKKVAEVIYQNSQLKSEQVLEQKEKDFNFEVIKQFFNNDLIHDFLQDIEKSIQQVEFLYKNNRMEELKYELHSLKGVAGMFGAHRIQTTSNMFESEIEKSAFDIDYISILQKSLDDLKKYIKNEMNRRNLV